MSSPVINLLLIFLVWYSSICLTSSVPNEYSISSLDLDKFTLDKQVFHLFQIWKKETKREYQTLEEETTRFQIFKSNLKYMREKNAKRKSLSKYSLGLNKFSDMSYEEFSKIYLHETKEHIIGSNNSKMVPNDASCPDAPTSWDWRNKGAVTYVKDQDPCETCWAFSATGAMEGINQIVSGRLVALSEQQLISCDKNSRGCKGGGWYGNAFQYVIKNGGIASEDDYPYLGKDSACDSALEQKKSATIDGFKYWLRPISESSLSCYVYKKPVSVSIFASMEFMFYGSGIFDGDDCTDIDYCTHNHAVLIVGYGSSSDGQDYWIVKNSWGSTWGQHGYILIKRNTGTAQGVCNINCYGAYPTKENKEKPALKLSSSI